MSAITVHRVLAVVLLAGMGAHRCVTVRRPARVAEYHERVRNAAKEVPHRIAGWVGEDVPVPVQAVTLLDPNVLISRRYLNVENGANAGVFLVHCADAHDMAGHFPLRCYRAQGWGLRAQRERDWTAGDLRVTGTEYEFFRDDGIGGAKPERGIVVVNCLLRPGGLLLRDMDAMNKSVIGAGGQSSGAGQLQVYFDAGTPQEQRDRAVEALVVGYRPVLDAILARMPAR
jgi:hypothetical protein